MKRALWVFLSLYVSVMVIACGKSENDISGSDGSGANGGCPIGSTFYLGYCMNGNGQPITGYNGVAYQSATATNGYSTAGQLTITNTGVYTQMLREAFGICGQSAYAGGMADCTNFTYFMASLQAANVQTNTVRLTLETYPVNYNSNSSWYINAPSWQQASSCALTSFFFGGCYMMPNQYQGQYYHSNVLPLDMVVSNINNSKGFEGRSYGAYGTISQNKLIQLQVNNGKLQDGYFSFQLVYGGQGNVFAQGTMVRCNNVSCGLYY